MNYNSLTCAMRTYRARVFTLTWTEQYTHSLEANTQSSFRNEVLDLNFIYMCPLARTVDFRSQFGLITQIGKCWLDDKNHA